MSATFTAASDAQTATDWRNQTDEQARTRYEALTPRAQRDLRAALCRHDMRVEMDGEWAHGVTLTVGTDDVVFVVRTGGVFTIEHANYPQKLGTDGCWYDRVPQEIRWFTRERVETVLLDLVRGCTY
ncbi:hypothetical protein [Herbidospora mongoliensis]|uniref:hypothetical protein n=1 Tax=Herbidospora mongoliensis TaxID=688067 RepID=UPI000837178C|nr:hypothetical protein [Herbidospora mongoliensis]